MQKIITDSDLNRFNSRVQEYLDKGWVVVTIHTSMSGSGQGWGVATTLIAILETRK